MELNVQDQYLDDYEEEDEDETELDDAFSFITKSIKSVTDKAKLVMNDAILGIRDNAEKRKIQALLESESFQSLLNYIVIDYVKGLCNWRNRFEELSKDDCRRIAIETKQPQYIEQITEYVHKVYMPIFYSSFCELISSKKKVYKLVSK